MFGFNIILTDERLIRLVLSSTFQRLPLPFKTMVLPTLTELGSKARPKLSGLLKIIHYKKDIYITLHCVC
jgi:hypothetical protein